MVWHEVLMAGYGVKTLILSKWDVAAMGVAALAQGAASLMSMPEWFDYVLRGGALLIVAFVIYRLFMYEVPAWRRLQAEEGELWRDEARQWRAEISAMRREQSEERESHREAIHDITSTFREAVQVLNDNRNSAVERVLREIRGSQ